MLQEEGLPSSRSWIYAMIYTMSLRLGLKEENGQSHYGIQGFDKLKHATLLKEAVVNHVERRSGMQDLLQRLHTSVKSTKECS